MSQQNWLDLYLQSLIARNRSPRTVAWYADAIQRYLRWVDQTGENWCGVETVEAYLADGLAAGLAPATVAGHYRALRAWFGWLARRRYIADSPMDQVEAPHVPRQEPRRVQVDEYLRLLESIPADSWLNSRDRLIIATLFLCGVRLGECANLRAGDYRLPEHLLRVEGKTGIRLVPLLPAVERELVAYLYMRPATETERLFVAADGAGNATGQAIQAKGIYQMLRRRCRRLGLRHLNPHSFRHGLATYLLNAGGDMSLVQRILGHSQISTTARYYADWLVEGLQREFAAKMRGLGL